VEVELPDSLDCELLWVERTVDGVLLDAVTMVPVEDEDGEMLPAGWPVTLCLRNPDLASDDLVDDLTALAGAQVGCRVGLIERDGASLLVVASHDDCVVVLVVDPV
jgi:hypothetical protein